MVVGSGAGTEAPVSRVDGQGFKSYSFPDKRYVLVISQKYLNGV